MKNRTLTFVMVSFVAAALGCSSDSTLVSPSPTLSGSLTSTDGYGTASGSRARPIQGDCTTQFTPIDPNEAGACAVFDAQPSAFIRITGECRLAHLGRTELTSVQQLLFALDATGQPVIQNGQPVVTALRNCTTWTAADGDAIHHTSDGVVSPGVTPTQFNFDGAIVFTGGTGRFTGASGTASYEGTADLAVGTGSFSLEGSIVY
jgi:hypothetical protein